MALDDFVHVIETNALIPNAIRIDDDGRATLAGIEAAGFVGAHFSLQTAAVQLFLEFIGNGQRAFGRTTPPGVVRGALINANENVIIETVHKTTLD